jgi:hypothetical protein
VVELAVRMVAMVAVVAAEQFIKIIFLLLLEAHTQLL